MQTKDFRLGDPCNRHRRRLVRAAGLLALVVTAAPATRIQAEEPPATRLATLVRSALRTHESVARAESELRRAAADVRLSSAALLPRFDLNANLSRFQSEQAVEFAPGQTFIIRPLSDWNYSVDLKQTLFYGLRDWRARNLARLRHDANELELLTVRSDLALEVSHAFFDAVAAEQQVEVRTKALELAESQLQVARRRFEVGEVTAADVARWRAQRAAELQELVLIQGQTELARRRLARLAGIEGLGTLEILDPVPVPEGSDSAAELTAAALEKRRELEVLRRRRAAAQLAVRIERGARLPELDAHFQYYVQKAEFPSEDWVSLSLALTVPIYDGGIAAARTAKASEDLTQLDLLIREMEKAIRDQVDVAVIGYRTATAALEAARERRAAASEAQRQTELAYRVGEATATELLDAGTELADAATDEVIARWQRELQAIALRHAVGEPPVPGVELVAPPALPETKEGKSP